MRASLTLDKLAANLAAGLRTTFDRRIRMQAFHVETDQAVLLIVLALLLQLGLDRALAGSTAVLDEYGLARQGALLLSALFALWLVARLAGGTGRWLRLLVLFGSVAPVYVVAQAALEWAWLHGLSAASYEVVAWMLLAWFGLLALRLVAVGSERRHWVVIGLTLVLLGVGWTPQFMLSYASVWYEVGDAAPYQAPTVNVEELFYAQPERVEQALAEVLPGRPGVVDLYFVGFGGDASQDVFMREIGHAREVMEQRFDTAGRSVSLVNNPDTADRLPIASLSNLRRVLAGVAGRMDRDEDILLLFLSSHGSKQHELAVEFWPLTLNTIRPDDLRQALDEAGIRWRVLVVSACYSGGFLPALSDPRTLVMTASAADRQSFGCANKNEYTYFGRALFKEALAQDLSLPGAFELARRRVEERERAQGNEPSLPKIHVGDDIRRQLARLEWRLADRNH